MFRLTRYLCTLPKEAAVSNPVKLEPKLIGVARDFAPYLASGVLNQPRQSKKRAYNQTATIPALVLDFYPSQANIKKGDVLRELRDLPRHVVREFPDDQVSAVPTSQVRHRFVDATIDRHQTQPQVAPHCGE